MAVLKMTHISATYGSCKSYGITLAENLIRIKNNYYYY